MAYPVKRDKELNAELNKLTNLRSKFSPVARGVRSFINIDSTLDISKKLAPYLKNPNVSPLSIGYELERRGYDPAIWIKYVTDHQKELDLKGSQSRQLDKPDSYMGTIDDWWLNAFTGEE